MKPQHIKICGVAKAVLRGKCIALTTHIKPETRKEGDGTKARGRERRWQHWNRSEVEKMSKINKSLQDW